MGLIEGAKVHCHVIKFGFYEDIFVKNTLIYFFFAYYRVECSKHVFYENPHSCDVVTWNAILEGFARDG